MASPLALRHNGWAGGVYLLDDPAPDQAQNIVNMVLEPNGRAYKRAGSTDFASLGGSSDRILSSYLFKRVGNPDQLIAHVSDGKCYYSTDGGVNWTNMQVAAHVSTTQPASFETFNGNLYFVDGANGVQKWTGSVLSSIFGAPNAFYLRLWKDTMWALRTVSQPDRVFSSAPADADTWPASNFVDIAKGDGYEGTGLYVDGQFLYAGKRNRTYAIVSPSTFENRVHDYDKGLESHWSVVQFRGEMYYLTRFGIARHVGSGPGEIVSENIRPLFHPNFLAMDKMNTISGYVFGDRVGWSLTRIAQTLPDFQIEYYPGQPRKPWTFHGFPARAFVTLRDSSERLFYGRTTSNKFTEAFAGPHDSGTNFKGLIEGRWEDFGAPQVRKYLRQMRLLGEGRYQVFIQRDYIESAGKMFIADFRPLGDPKWNENAQDRWGDEKWGTLGTASSQRIAPDTYGRYFAIRMTDLDGLQVSYRRPVGERVITDNNMRQWSTMGFIMESVPMGEFL